MKTVYFDYPCVLLRTHLMLQEMKRVAGTKLFLHTRKRLAELWTIIHKERYTENWPNIDTFINMVDKMELMIERSERYGEKITENYVDETLQFYKNNNRTNYHWFGVPVKLMEDKTLYEAIKAIETFKINLQHGFDEIDDLELWDMDWDEGPIAPFEL